MMRVSSEHLYLRELTAADCSAEYVAWLNDPAVSRFLETRHSDQTAESVRSFVEAVSARENETLFGIFLNDDDRHIGNIKAGPIHPIHKVGDVSLFIGAKDCWGRGYAAEAIAAVSAYAFEYLAAAKLSASMFSPNLGSARAFLKVGYLQEGYRRKHGVLDGERCDIVVLGLLPGELRPLAVGGRR
jgi:RimJ/RimL family protein N-acetyltransferase